MVEVLNLQIVDLAAATLNVAASPPLSERLQFTTAATTTIRTMTTTTSTNSCYMLLQ